MNTILITERVAVPPELIADAQFERALAAAFYERVMERMASDMERRLFGGATCPGNNFGDSTHRSILD